MKSGNPLYFKVFEDVLSAELKQGLIFIKKPEFTRVRKTICIAPKLGIN